MSFHIRVDDRVSLRLLEPHHAAEVFAVIDANRDHVGKWLPWVETTRSPEDVKAFAERALKDFVERKQAALSALEDGKVVGGAGWHDWQTGEANNVWRGSFDIGYWLDERAQGRGIITRCVRAILDLAFGDYGLERVTIRAEPANARSRGVPRRLGFTLEGTHRHVCRWSGRWIDHEMYAMLADEWKAKRSRGV